MKNNKGFVFIETIIVVAILITSLIYLYSTYVSLTNNENRRLFYDDVSYIYRAYYVKKYFSSQRIDRYVNSLSNANQTENVNFIISFGCGSDEVFDDFEKESGFCELLSQEMHLSQVYVTYNDLSSIQNCGNNTSGLCATYSRVNSHLAAYLQTLGGKGKTGFRMIVEFQEDGMGHACQNLDQCRYYYASLELGDIS